MSLPKCKNCSNKFTVKDLYKGKIYCRKCYTLHKVTLLTKIVVIAIMFLLPISIKLIYDNENLFLKYFPNVYIFDILVPIILASIFILFAITVIPHFMKVKIKNE